MKAIVDIDVCCNDPDNGVFAGKAFMIQWGDVEFAADDWNGYSFTAANGFIRLHRRKFTILASKEWVGNWCWNRYSISRDDAKRLLRAMAETGFWHCDCAPTRFYNWFGERRSSGRRAA